MGKYHPYDPSPEAVKWRQVNKKRMRPYVCKLPRDQWHLQAIVIWLLAVVVLLAVL